MLVESCFARTLFAGMQIMTMALAIWMNLPSTVSRSFKVFTGEDIRIN